MADFVLELHRVPLVCSIFSLSLGAPVSGEQQLRGPNLRNDFAHFSRWWRLKVRCTFFSGLFLSGGASFVNDSADTL